jgi:hypothetical protein
VQLLASHLKDTFSNKEHGKQFLKKFWTLAANYEWTDLFSRLFQTIVKENESHISFVQIEQFLRQMDADRAPTSAPSAANLILETLQTKDARSWDESSFVTEIKTVEMSKHQILIQYVRKMLEFCDLVASMPLEDMALFVATKISPTKNIKASLEWKKTLGQCFAFVDSDNSNSLKLEELVSFFGEDHKDALERAFSGMDDNEDGEISKLEFKTALLGAEHTNFGNSITKLVDSMGELGSGAKGLSGMSVDDLESLISDDDASPSPSVISTPQKLKQIKEKEAVEATQKDNETAYEMNVVKASSVARLTL